MRPPRPRTTTDRRAADSAGRRGERLAAWWLRLKGWRILDRRVRTPAGEVDLVARRGPLVAFVEVKTRATAAELDHAIDERRLARVAAAAEVLMPRYAGPGDDIRVDVILMAPGTRPRHIENAWIGCPPFPVRAELVEAPSFLLPAAQAEQPFDKLRANGGNRVSLTVAVQMDPLAGINIAGDSSFALMLSAQARGHRLFHYLADDLSYAAGRVWAKAHPVTVRRVEGDHFTLGDPVGLDLGDEADVVLMRQDPPFDLGYITATHLLERIADRTLVVNDPASVRNAPEKVFVLDYPQFMPPTLVTRSLDEARRFLAEHGEIVVKPLHGNGGKAIFRVGSDGANLSALIEVFNQTWREPHMIQAFLPAVAAGDKRIVLVDGEVAGAINRLPGAGEIRSNLAVGGSAEKTELTPREREICAALGPELKRRGLLFVGIDVIGGEWLTEINVTSPTGIVAIERFDGTDVAGMIWDAIERRVAERA